MVSAHSNSEKTKHRNSFEKLAENVSLKSEDISWLIDSLPVTVFRSSSKLSWGMDYISTNVEKLTGYSKTEFIDQKLLWSDIVLPEDSTIIDRAVKKAKKNKSSYKIEYKIKKSDGSTAFIQEQAHMVCDDSGKLAYIAGVFLDLTSEVKRRGDSHDLNKEDERTQLEMFRSFVERISAGEEIEQISGNFTGETKKTVDLINRSIENIMGVLGEITTISKAGKEGHLSIRANDSKYPGGWGMLLRELNSALDAIISPLNVAAEYVERISRGDIPEPITDDYYGDFGEIKNNLNTCIAAVNNLIEDSLMLSEAGVAGRLDTRADAARHEGDFRRIVEGVNDTLDAVIGPLNIAAEYVERISRGDIPEPIIDNYNGDFNEIKNNLNNCIEGLQGLVECNNVLHCMAMNDHTKSIEGSYVGIFASMGKATNEVRGRLLSVTNLMNEIAVGNTSQLVEFKKIGRRSEQDQLVPAFIQVMENINLLIEDAGMLSRAAVEGKLDTRADVSRHHGEYRKIVEGVNDTLDAVIGPLNVAAEYVERISRGDIPKPITDSYNGDFNEIKNNLNTCIVAVNNLIEDSLMLSEAGVAGRLDTRADAAKHHGDFRKIVEGINDTLDAVIGPLNIAAEYVERISRGDIPEPITENYNGDFNEIKNNLNNCIEGLQGLVECNNVLHHMAMNDHTKGVEGNYVGIFASMGEATNEVRGRLLSVTNLMNEIAVGDTSQLMEFKKIGRRSEQDHLLPAMIQAMESINLLIEDAGMLSRAAVEGKLDTRADVSRHHGEYRKIVEGVNDTLDAVIGPLNVAAEYVERISRGDIPKPITDSYNGDFNEIKNNLNTCIIAVNNLIEDSLMLSEAGVTGRLDTRADATRHEGDFRKIVKGVNDTLDSIIGPLNVAAEYVERISRGDIPEPIIDNYNGDFNEIKNNLNTCIDAINNLIEDSIMLSEAGVAGKLDIRSDATRHEGHFRGIIEGVNDTLDAVIGPLNVAAEYIERIGRGDIPEPITDNYNGDFNEIKNNLNSCIDGLQGLVECNDVLHCMAMNDHTKGVEGDHVGIFASMSRSTNEVRDRLLSVTKLMDEIAVGDTSQLVEFKKIGKRSEQDHLMPAMIQAMENINLLLEDTGMLTMAALAGKLDVRTDASKHKGEYRKVVQGVNDTLDAIICPLNNAAELIERISRGDIPETITDECHGDFKEIKNNLNTCIDAINNLIEDSLMLSAAGIEGRLDTRADATRHKGDFRRIVEGVNATLDAVIGPLNVAAEYVERISRGDIPEPIIDNYNGDFNEIKNNLNNCIEGLQGLVECNNVLHRMAMNDHTKSVEGKYVGIYASMSEGTNEVRDRLLKVTKQLNEIAVGDTSQLMELKRVGKRSEQDHLLPAVIEVMENINLLIEDAEMLSKAAVEGRLDTRANVSKHHGEYRKIVQGVNDTLDAVIGPLNVAAEYVERISRGDIPEPITDNYNGDFNEIKNNLNTCIAAVNNLIDDSLMLSKAGVSGQLDTRADATKHEGDFRKIVEGINDTLDAVIGPLNVAAEYVERISRGDIPQKITDNYNGDFNEIKNNLNNCIEGLQGLVECNNVLQRMAVNDHTKGVEGKYVGIYASMSEATNNVRDRVLNVTNQLNNISVGDTSQLEVLKKIGRRSEQDQLLPSIIRAMENVNLLIEDAGMLSKAAVEGKLDTRADVSRHHGEYRKIVEGVNDTLDAVIGPLNVAAEYVERISRGDIPELIRDNYNGDFNEIKNNLNTCIVAVNNLVEDALMLSEAGIAGKLDTRADATRHEGDFRKIVEGVNDTLDAVIGPLNVAAKYVESISRGDIPDPITDKYNGDFNEIKNNLNKCISAVNILVEDSLMLSEAGVAGKLNTRADASRHQGDFRKIVVGVNETLDAVIGPVNEAIRVSNEFSNGNFRARVDESLHVEGDFINFKRVLNEIGISVSEIIKSAKSVTLNVVDSSDEASKGADEVAKAAGNVAVSSQKTSELTRELLYKIEGINKEIIDLSSSNERIAGTSKGILSAADEVVRIGKDAQTLGKDTNFKMESVEKIAKESVDGINSLTEQIKQIDGIVQLINDITSQINLLSLNAAIEAARAGEHGRGFAVVAGEVKNLATKARNATETIENVVMSVQRDSKKTADAINTANNEIIDGVNSVNKTLDALNTIIKNATQVTKDIGDITRAIENQASISMNVVTASEEGNAMTREVQKEAEGLAAIAQEASASVQEIGAAIHEMTDLSNKLKSEMEVFMV